MDKQIRCTYCLQELNDMRDPRQLPCTHIFCMSCIKVHCQQETNIKCPICSNVSEEIKVELLEQIVTDKQYTTSDMMISTEHNCSRCQDKPAVKYCIDCTDKICDKHSQSHDDHYGESSRRTIDIQEYIKNEGLYATTMCNIHKNTRMSHCCSECYLLACADCDSSPKCSAASTEVRHMFDTLCRAKKDLRKEFSGMLNACADKVMEICKLEKETWLVLDSLIEKCEEMIRQVEKETEEQIAEIRDNSKKLIEEIKNYQVDRTNRAEEFVSGLVVKRDELEELQRTVRHLVHNQPITEIIEQKEEKTVALQQARETNLDMCDFNEQLLMSAGSYRQVEYVLKNTISTISYSGQTLTMMSGNNCDSLCFTSAGELLVSCSWYINHFTSQLEYKHSVQSGVFLSLEEGAVSEVFALNTNEQTCLYDSVQSTISAFPWKIAGAKHLAASSNYLALATNTTIHLLCRKTKVEANWTLNEVVSLRFQPNGELLAATKEGVLYNYELSYKCGDESITFRPTWKCQGLTDPYAMCTDENGLIYVATRGRQIHLVVGGRICRVLTNGDLPEYPGSKYGDIAVYNNVLVATHDGSKFVKVFNLHQ